MLSNILSSNGKIDSGVRSSAVASQPCPSGHITRAIRFTSLTQMSLQGTPQTPETLYEIKKFPMPQL